MNVLSPYHDNIKCTKSKEQNVISLWQKSTQWNVKKTENPEYVKFSGKIKKRGKIPTINIKKF
jgi:hypothetical protein